MPGELRAGLERISLAAQNFDDALGGEIHIGEAGASIGDLAIVGNAAIAQSHNCNPLYMARLPLASGSSDV
jgi:hypothetical protein